MVVSIYIYIYVCVLVYVCVSVHVCMCVCVCIYIYIQSWAVSPIQYLLRQKISIVDTFVFVFVSIIKLQKYL